MPSTWIIGGGEYMRLMIGFPLILLLFTTMAYALLNITDKVLLLLYLGIFFFTIFAMIYSVYAIARGWR
ncbi:MAG: hypothetical protein QXI20_12380 [Candidatus Jordarchaeales archaeon]